ncbi:MAG: hypothetical protein LBP95_07480 [Deltaproteobacteria bacterium]|jgi:hypothetical protein|nr:hypothetical protein [Deltaproteobacteria bacterium]
MPEPKAPGINAKLAVLDAGHLADENAGETREAGMSLATRMRGNRKPRKAVIAERLPSLKDGRNIVSHNARHAHVRRVACELVPGRRACACPGLDMSVLPPRSSRLSARAARGHMSDVRARGKTRARGPFVLSSARPAAKDETPPPYHAGRQTEQVFDARGNNTNLAPPRVQSEDTPRGGVCRLRSRHRQSSKNSGRMRERRNALRKTRRRPCETISARFLTAMS